MVVPEWLDADFLYRINYAPATLEEVARAQSTLRPLPEGTERQRITLLDRHIATFLHRSMFSESAKKQLFLTDWTEVMEREENADQTTLEGEPKSTYII